MPKLEVTVPIDLYRLVEAACGEAWVDSYLSGAIVSNQKLTPHTQYAWNKIQTTQAAMGVLKSLSIELLKPQPWSPERDRSILRVGQSYESMTLQGKIEHHLIEATKCANEAGPQWIHNRHADPDEMSPRWHEWTARKKHHLEEARRLKEIKASFQADRLAAE